MLHFIRLRELIASGFIPSPERDRWCRVWVDLGRQAKLGKILTTQNTASQSFPADGVLRCGFREEGSLHGTETD